jgi:Arc/MetJ-type ribon-helix-helix transcriptional regulator
MAERIVSVKMPGSLVQELRKLTAEHHYIDLSEQVRSIVRQKCLQYSSPYDDIKKLREDIEQQIKSANTQLKKQQILQELAKLLKEEGT